MQKHILVDVKEARHDERLARSSRLNFSDPTQREAHTQAFLAWLPEILSQAPGIRWDHVPSRVMGCLMLSDTHEDLVSVTLAVGCAMQEIRSSTLLSYCSQLLNLLRRLRGQYGMTDLAQLGTGHIWERFVAGRTLSPQEVSLLGIYDVLASLHLRRYLESLDRQQRSFWERYALPPLPAGLLDAQRRDKAVRLTAQQRSREPSEVPVLLFSLLAEIAQLRKQAVERLVEAFRRHRERAMGGEIELPYRFQYTARHFTVPEDALADVGLIEREVTLTLTLWDRLHWVKNHPERYTEHTRRAAEHRLGAYAPESNAYFLQFEGRAADLLWCGDLLLNRRLGNGSSSAPEGSSTGFYTNRPGLLNPTASDSAWLSKAVRPGELLFEPESLYRGTLFAAALTTLALTSGSRLNELLQVSATRFETLVVDELEAGQPTGRKIGILVQRLLPSGARHEGERQFFLIGEVSGRLLAEIGRLLEATHGGTIPVVHPYRNPRAEDLSPEPYLFQWGASADGRLGLLDPDDVGRLLRFLFYGLMTSAGRPTSLEAHLLRHVMTAHARTVEKVPAEAMAFLFQHRATLPDAPLTFAIPEALAYYNRLPVEQLLALLFEAQSALTSHRERSYLPIPPPASQQEMDAALRQTFEQWGMVGPTVLGYCSAGLCIRPTHRALCLGCPYLVPHYSSFHYAKTWRKLYLFQAELYAAQGHVADARQARQLLQYLDDIIKLMWIQIRVRQDGGQLPFAHETLMEDSTRGSAP